MRTLGVVATVVRTAKGAEVQLARMEDLPLVLSAVVECVLLAPDVPADFRAAAERVIALARSYDASSEKH
jgi:hypothetical protein